MYLCPKMQQDFTLWSFAVLFYTFPVWLGKYIWQRAGLSSEQSSPGLFADPGSAVTHICWIQ